MNSPKAIFFTIVCILFISSSTLQAQESAPHLTLKSEVKRQGTSVFIEDNLSRIGDDLRFTFNIVDGNQITPYTGDLYIEGSFIPYMDNSKNVLTVNRQIINYQRWGHNTAIDGILTYTQTPDFLPYLGFYRLSFCTPNRICTPDFISLHSGPANSVDMRDYWMLNKPGWKGVYSGRNLLSQVPTDFRNFQLIYEVGSQFTICGMEITPLYHYKNNEFGWWMPSTSLYTPSHDGHRNMRYMLRDFDAKGNDFSGVLSAFADNNFNTNLDIFWNQRLSTNQYDPTTFEGLSMISSVPNLFPAYIQTPILVDPRGWSFTGNQPDNYLEYPDLESLTGCDSNRLKPRWKAIWKAELKPVTISVPVYSGVGYLLSLWEVGATGNPEPRFDNSQEFINHEEWYLAPGIGVVKGTQKHFNGQKAIVINDQQIIVAYGTCNKPGIQSDPDCYQSPMVNPYVTYEMQSYFDPTSPLEIFVGKDQMIIDGDTNIVLPEKISDTYDYYIKVKNQLGQSYFGYLEYDLQFNNENDNRSLTGLWQNGNPAAPTFIADVTSNGTTLVSNPVSYLPKGMYKTRFRPYIYDPRHGLPEKFLSLPWSNEVTVFVVTPGNINGNLAVDIFDYNLLVQNFGKTGRIGWIEADINSDGKVDISDLNILVGNFGK